MTPKEKKEGLVRMVYDIKLVKPSNCYDSELDFVNQAIEEGADTFRFTAKEGTGLEDWLIARKRNQKGESRLDLAINVVFNDLLKDDRLMIK